MEINKKIVNSKFISEVLSYKEFEDLDIILESGTGTGKSHTFTKYAEQFIREKNSKIISIFGKIYLGEQQKAYFNNAGIKTNFYKDKGFKFEDNILICINSLSKYIDEIDKYGNDFILFIDEISIFTSEITHNETIDKLQIIYCLIKKLILRADKIFVCQNEINDAALCLLDKRHTKNKNILFVKNEYKNNANKDAIVFESFDVLLEKMKKEDRPYLFACDSKSIIDKVYHILKNNNMKYRIVKITSKTDRINIKDFEWNNTIILYSPSIITGVDCSLEHAQNQYIHITGVIEGNLLYQMAMRTRNLKSLYISYDEKKTKTKLNKYTSLENCKQIIEKGINHSSSILSKMCIYINENDEAVKNINNSFFELYCQNEYIHDLSICNIIKSFEDIVSKNGFIIKYVLVDTNCDVENELMSAKLEIKKMEDEEYIKYINGDVEDEKMDKLMDYLKIISPDDKMKYKNYIVDDYNLKAHINCIKFFYKIEFLKYFVERMTEKTFNIKVKESSIYKFIILKKMLQTYNIDIYNLNENIDSELTLTEEDKKNIIFIFDKRVKVNKFTKKRDLIKFIVGKINLFCTCGENKLIKSRKTGKDNIVCYSINEEFLKENFDLYSYRAKYGYIEDKLKKLLDIKEEEHILMEIFD